MIIQTSESTQSEGRDSVLQGVTSELSLRNKRLQVKKKGAGHFSREKGVVKGTGECGGAV